VDATPTASLRELPRDVYVDPPIRDQMDVQTVPFVQLEYAETGEHRPSRPQQRQQVVPAFSGCLDVEGLCERERPHVKRLLSERLRRKQVSCFALRHDVLGVV
jgi:hypothetical protein